MTGSRAGLALLLAFAVLGSVPAAGGPRTAVARPVAPLAALFPLSDTARYDIVYKFIGYTGLVTSKECDGMTNPASYDSLAGVVGGREAPAPRDEDVEYEGVVRRFTRIDFCLVVGPDGNNKWCVGTLRGSAKMRLHVTVYGEEGRGAYVKADTVRGGLDSVSVAGNCDRAEMEELRRDYPGGGSGGSPSGQEIPETDPPRLYASGQARLRMGYYPPPKDQESSGWSLRVLRKLP